MSKIVSPKGAGKINLRRSSQSPRPSTLSTTPPSHHHRKTSPDQIPTGQHKQGHCHQNQVKMHSSLIITSIYPPPLSFVKNILRPDVHRARRPCDIIRRRDDIEPSRNKIIIPLVISQSRCEQSTTWSCPAHHELAGPIECVSDGRPFDPEQQSVCDCTEYKTPLQVFGMVDWDSRAERCQ